MDFKPVDVTEQTPALVYRVADEVTSIGADALPPDHVRLNTGVVVRILSIPPEALEALSREFTALEPHPPIVKIASKGREEENPSDPDYIKAHKRWEGEFSFALLLVIYALGVELVSVPSDFPGPDDPAWSDERTISRLSSGASSRARFVDWLRYRAMINRALDSRQAQALAGKDKEQILYAAGRALGSVQADVQEATKSV